MGVLVCDCGSFFMCINFAGFNSINFGFGFASRSGSGFVVSMGFGLVFFVWFLGFSSFMSLNGFGLVKVWCFSLSGFGFLGLVELFFGFSPIFGFFGVVGLSSFSESWFLGLVNSNVKAFWIGFLGVFGISPGSGEGGG